MRKISPSLALIVFTQAKSYRKAAKILKISHTTPYNILNKKNLPQKKAKKGRTSLIDDRLSRRILNYIKKQKELNLQKVIKYLKLQISTKTLKRFLKNKGFNFEKVEKKKFIKK